MASSDRSNEREAVSVPEPSSDDDRGHQVPYRQILSHQMADALREYDRPGAGLVTSAFSAGLDVGFGPFLMAVYLTVTGPAASDPATKLVLAFLYSLGFLFVVLGRSELFTEHTTMAVLPVLAGHARLGELLRVWAIIWVGNIAGVVVFSAFAVFVGPHLGVIDPSAFQRLALGLTEHQWWVMLLSAILAGWLMGLLTWLVQAARETIGQVVIVVLTAGSIGLAGLHHAIAGSVEVLFGVFDGIVSVPTFAMVLLWATIGNAIGGAVFVALLKYAHVVRSQPDPEEIEESEREQE